MSVLSIVNSIFAQLKKGIMKDFTAKTLIAQYTKRDLILYALGIGCCSDDTDNEDTYNRELQYVY